MNRDVARRVRAPRIDAGGVRPSEPPHWLPHQLCNLGLFVWLALMWPLGLTAQLGGPVGTAVLNGAVSPRIHSSLDRGRLDPTKRLSHITLTLQRTPEQRTELERLLEQQQDPLSPNYRKWITPERFADRFGAPASEIDEIADWLRSQGFTVESTARSRGWIVFSGVAGQAETAFHTEIHQYESGGRLHFGPAAPPAIPARFDGRIESIRGLDDFYPEPPRRFRPLAELANGGNALAPGDLVRIYGFNTQAFSYPTAGWQIAIAGDSDINLSDIQQFQNTFQLAYNMPRLVLAGDDPGVDSNGGLLEANADLEWADAAAPRASLIYVYAQNVFDAAQEAIDQDLAQILSFSYGLCESDVAAGDASAIRDLAQLANAQGITWVASSGDAGAAACDAGSYPATQGLSVSFPASLPEVTGVGGTEFNEGSGSYWTTNRPDYSSATGYIPEVAWNDSSQTLGLWASGGGLSVLYQEPAWQNGPGLPAYGAREVPDLALSASVSHDPYLVYSGGTLYGAGGTSLSAPVFAGILALTGIGVAFNGGGSAGFGNVNPELYSLAAGLAQTTSSPFHDIQSGDNIVPCVAATPDCWNGSFGYRAGPGYDLATGLGTPIVSNFQFYFQAPTTTSLSVSPSQVTQGAAVTLTATVRSFDGGIPAGAVEVDDGHEPVAGGAALDATGALVMSYTPSWGGPHLLTAKYRGGSRYAGSTSGSVSLNAIPPAPAAPALSTPLNGAAGVAAPTWLGWSSQDYSTTYETYNVYFGTSPSPPYWGNVTSTSCAPPSLAANTTYYWRVAAVNASGAAPSPVWSFTTSPQTLYTISRIAGGNQEGFAGDGGPATQALLNYATDIQLDAKGDIYVADRGNHRVRMIAPNGVISTIAGSGSATYSGDGGPAVNAGIPEPTGLAMDSRGNLYISDQEYGCVRMVAPDGTISTVVGVCHLPSSTIFAGAGLAVDSQDNLYFASSACIGKMAGGVITVVAGQCGVSPSDPSGIYGDGGPATSAILSYGIEGIAVDAAGNLYIADNNADNGHGSLREVSNGIITTFARGSMVWIAPGPGSTFYYTDAFLSVCQIGAGGAAVDIAGSGNGASPGTGAVAALSAYLYYTQGIRVGSAGRIYFADSAGVYVLTPVSGNPGPTLAANNVWNAAGFGGAALAPGSLATVSGGFSLPTASQAAGLPLPTALSGLSFQFETGAGIAAPLFYASVGQAILQIPWETAGLSTVPLSASLNGNTGPAAVIPIAPFGPGIFTMNGTSTGQGAILNSWYQLADSSSPAAPGEVIEIYCTGLGPVRNAPTSGYPASLTALSPTVTTPSVTIGGIPAAVWFSGLAPGSVGEYQVDAQVPAGAPSGPAVPVVISIGGVTSNIVTIAVQ